MKDVYNVGKNVVNLVDTVTNSSKPQLKPQLRGTSGYTINARTVQLRVSKIDHDYNGSTGTLRLQLCKNYWFYGKYNNYGEYDLIAEYRVGEIRKGYYRHSICVTVPKICDGKSYNNCYTLFLEEYTGSGWKVRDYVDFDN